jgi:tRNA threonylcarbamoyl adenosine modification protein YeaZ
VLAFDTTGPIISVGAAVDSQPLHRRDQPSERSRGNLLDILIEEVLQAVDWRRTDIEGLALLTGPGSLTAIRIGWATAAGWAQAAQIPLIGWTVPAAHRRVWRKARKKVNCCVHYRGDAFLLYDLSKSHDDPNVVHLRESSGSENPPEVLTGPGVIGNRARWEGFYRGMTQIAKDSDATIGADTLALWGEEELRKGHLLSLDDSPLDYGLPPDFRKISAR